MGINLRHRNEQRFKLHEQCEVILKPRGPHIGAYCANPKCKRTGAWIIWLPQRIVNLEA